MLQSMWSQRVEHNSAIKQRLVDAWAVYHENPKAGCLGSAQAATAKHHRLGAEMYKFISHNS